MAVDQERRQWPDQGRNNGAGEKQMETGHITEVEPRELADGLNARSERGEVRLPPVYDHSVYDYQSHMPITVVVIPQYNTHEREETGKYKINFSHQNN